MSEALFFSADNSLSYHINWDNGQRHYKHCDPFHKVQPVTAQHPSAQLGHNNLHSGNCAHYPEKIPVIDDAVENVQLLGPCVECVEHRREDKEIEIAREKILCARSLIATEISADKTACFQSPVGEVYSRYKKKQA